MQVFEEVIGKTDKIFVMLESHEAALIVDALELISKHFPKKKKLQTLSNDISNSFPYRKSDLFDCHILKGTNVTPIKKK